jgi:hypothetical protein
MIYSQYCFCILILCFFKLTYEPIKQFSLCLLENAISHNILVLKSCSERIV